MKIMPIESTRQYRQSVTCNSTKNRKTHTHDENTIESK